MDPLTNDKDLKLEKKKKKSFRKKCIHTFKET